MAEFVNTISTQIPEHLIGGTQIPLLTKNVTVSSGSDLKCGTVLGKITASGKYVIVNSKTMGEVPENQTDGSQNAECILCHDVDASLSDKVATVYISGIFNRSELMFGGTDTAEIHEDKLRNLNIILTDLK